MKKEVYQLLSKQFKNRQEVMTEIINLQAILNLPKGTEHFLSDLHGEADAFKHLLRIASGVIKTKIELALGNELTLAEKNDLAALIYEPKDWLESRKKSSKNLKKEYKTVILRLLEVAKLVAAKYTRSKVRKALPDDYRYIIDELINMPPHSLVKAEYYGNIVQGIVDLGNADNFIEALCGVISRLAVDHMHIVGDVYDRGNGAAQIMEMLRGYHSVDIEWGNHDALWMGAHFGNKACVCNLLRINCAYRNLQGIENGYGINLRPLVTFALEEYRSGDLSSFAISDVFGKESDLETNDLLAKMTKAITVIQLKLENQLIKAHPEFGMDDRILYPSDTLTEKESALIDFITQEFTDNKRLKRDVEFMLSHGSMYRVHNGDLLMHGCVPSEENGEFSSVPVGKEFFSGKALYDRLDKLVRSAATGEEYSVDYMWYLWCGKKSPLFGRDKMNVYRKYFTSETETENKDPYYELVKSEKYCLKVLKEFGLTWKHSTIINGHVPVKVKDGERPESGKCRHITIDGGLSKAYRNKTGIGGYTLIKNSQGLFLAMHSMDEENEGWKKDSETRTLKLYDERILVKQTDNGKELEKQIAVLKGMLKDYYS
ncbi:MAG: fructose-bisphosphatase class III [Clostridia bacterium]|nr:fructose-bisphosphatase class III [Clostridia bacterium]